MKLILNLVCACMAAVALNACSEGRTRPPQVAVTILNAAPGFIELDFRRGQRSEATLQYRQVSQRALYDADSYNFHAWAAPVGASSYTLEVGSLSDELTPDNDYLYVMTQPVWSDPAVEILHFARPTFSSSNTNAEFTFVHAASAVTNVDVYFTAPGTDIATATPVGSVAYRGGIAPVATATGEYVLTLTEAGNASNVLFTSATVTIPAGFSTPLVLVDGANGGTQAMAIVIANSTSNALTDVAAQAAVRVINGASDRGARDVYLGDDFTTAFLPDVAFASPTALTPVPLNQTKITLTPAGNVGAIEKELTTTFGPGNVYSLVFAGSSGSLQTAVDADNFRVIFDQARVQVINLVNHVVEARFFIQPEGTDFANALPIFGLVAPAISTRSSFPLGRYEILIRDFATDTVLFGPQPYDMTAPGVYTLVAVDNADGTTADVVLLDDLQ